MEDLLNQYKEADKDLQEYETKHGLYQTNSNSNKKGALQHSAARSVSKFAKTSI